MQQISLTSIAEIGEQEIGIIGTILIIILGVVFLSFRNKSRSADKQNNEEQKTKLFREKPTEALLTELLIEARKTREACEKIKWPIRITAFVMILILFYGFKVVVR